MKTNLKTIISLILLIGATIMNTQSQHRVYPINRYTSIKQFNGDMQAYTIDNFEHNHRYTHYENGTIGRLIDDVTADGLELKSFMISYRSFVNGMNDRVGVISFSFEKASELNKKIDNKEDFIFFYLQLSKYEPASQVSPKSYPEIYNFLIPRYAHERFHDCTPEVMNILRVLVPGFNSIITAQEFFYD